eukprot:TRINITY_DN1454_c0_g1_i2.p2 TRINITY_DN1454_c0_g1~~TRINITY_DN1454_c0_g1_i2.p2  ORF type:complete len:110 (-),score=17.86 TRINITY_DN1454_c0_g1_i2:56-385(-)
MAAAPWQPSPSSPWMVPAQAYWQMHPLRAPSPHIAMSPPPSPPSCEPSAAIPVPSVAAAGRLPRTAGRGESPLPTANLFFVTGSFTPVDTTAFPPAPAAGRSANTTNSL